MYTRSSLGRLLTSVVRAKRLMVRPLTSAACPVAVDQAEYTETNYIADINRATSKNLIITSATCIATLGAISGTLVVAPQHFVPVVASVFLGSLGLGLVASFKVRKPPPIIIYNNQKIEIKNDPSRLRWSQILFATYGVLASPGVFVCADVFPQALLATGALVLGSSTAALFFRDHSLVRYSGAISTGLWGLLVVGIVGVWYPLFHTIDLYGGLAFFCLIQAFDTHVALESYKQNKIDPLGHSIDFGLNMINIFSRLLEIFQKIKRRN